MNIERLTNTLTELERKIHTIAIVCVVCAIASIFLGSLIGFVISVAGAITGFSVSDELRIEMFLEGMRKDLR